jgi:hypothetical protein
MYKFCMLPMFCFHVTGRRRGERIDFGNVKVTSSGKKLKNERKCEEALSKILKSRRLLLSAECYSRSK